MGDRVRTVGADPIDFGRFSSIGDGPPLEADASVRIGRTTVEIAAILDGVASRLQPLAEVEPVGSALQTELFALTAALRGPDPQRAATALALARALAIGRLVLASAKDGVSASSADTMTLAVNLEAAEGILQGIEHADAQARSGASRVDQRADTPESK